MTFDISIKKYVFSPVKSNMYVIICKSEALIIDPNISEEALLELKNRGVTFITILLTHEHYDHTTGVCWFQEKFESHLICHENCAKAILKGRYNRPVMIAAIIMKNGNDASAKVLDKLPQNYICIADDTFETEMQLDWCNHYVKLVHTPGHTKGSCCIELDGKYIFTGDSLLSDTAVITRFPTGSQTEYETITLPYLRGISPKFHVLPGHGESFLMQEVNRNN